MRKTFSSRRISSAIASRSASRTVMLTNSVPAGMAGSEATFAVADRAGLGLESCASCGALFTLIDWGPASAAMGGETCFGFSGGVFGGADAGTASPSWVSSAIGALTLTPSAPSGTSNFAMRPSSMDSNSIVALSVSISARISPVLTVSPSLTCHLASLPSSMVGDSAGIRI